MSIRTQPLLGIVALVFTMILSLAIIALFDAQTFATWVTFFVVICVPVEIVFGLAWELNYPPFVRRLGQPMRGLAFLIMTLVIAAVLAVVIFNTQAAGVAPPTPFALIYVIFCVLVTFWFVVVWQCWPITAVSTHPLATGIGALVMTYLLGYVLYALLFNFGFMAGNPIYSPAIAPQGAFPAFNILSFSVTTVTFLFVCILFDFWPMTAAPKLRSQPLLGLASTVYILVLTVIAYGIGVGLLGIDPVKFMVHGAIGLLFGALVPIIMFEGKLFANLAQPAKGFAQLAVAIVAGAVLPRIYGALAPVVSGELASGPPAYEYELWLASALLAMTFPLMVVVGQYFDFWPLRRPQKTGEAVPGTAAS